MIALLVILTPLAAALVSLVFASRTRLGLVLGTVATLPAFAYSVFGDADQVRVFEWLILETHLGLGFSGPIFLFFTAALWFIAGWYALGYMAEKKAGIFPVFWSLTLTGNLGLVLAGDVPSFYTFFALMTFSAYGLVVSQRSEEAWRAGRIYILLALAGEAMLIGAFLLAVSGADSFLLADAAASIAGSPYQGLIMFLALAGFGVKAGVFPLHLWLPLAHPVAPTPASAVLSGVMIKAGLIGWIQLLPGGHGGFPGWSAGVILVGLLTAFYAVACGLAQRNLKTLLAYSSVSQMGIMLVVVGAGLADPDAWGMAVVVLGIYALNHAFAKGSLFLGVGVCSAARGAETWRRRAILVGLALPALAIAGAPLMGGAIAKEAVKLVTEIPVETVPWLRILLPLSAVATALLLGRFMILANREMKAPLSATQSGSGLWLPWVASLAATLVGVYFAIPWFALELRTAEPSLLGIWQSVWPILAGAGVLVGIRFLPEEMKKGIRIPPGDIVVFLERLSWQARRRLGRFVGAERWRIEFHRAIEGIGRSPFVQAIMARGESFFRQKETAALLMIALVLVLWVLLGY